MPTSTQRNRTATNSQSRRTGMSGSRIASGGSGRGGNRAAMGPQTIRGARARMVNTPTSGTSGH